MVRTLQFLQTTVYITLFTKTSCTFVTDFYKTSITGSIFNIVGRIWFHICPMSVFVVLVQNFVGKFLILTFFWRVSSPLEPFWGFSLFSFNLSPYPSSEIFSFYSLRRSVVAAMDLQSNKSARFYSLSLLEVPKTSVIIFISFLYALMALLLV